MNVNKMRDSRDQFNAPLGHIAEDYKEDFDGTFK